MKVKKSIKETLVNLIKQVTVNGNPDSEQFKKAVIDYQEIKDFVNQLEV